MMLQILAELTHVDSVESATRPGQSMGSMPFIFILFLFSYIYIYRTFGKPAGHAFQSPNRRFPEIRWAENITKILFDGVSFGADAYSLFFS